MELCHVLTRIILVKVLQLSSQEKEWKEEGNSNTHHLHPTKQITLCWEKRRSENYHKNDILNA